jgi:precorrin-6A/cobalt-precorrin-6A reductase
VGVGDLDLGVVKIDCWLLDFVMTRILILGGTGDSAKLIPQLAALHNVETIASLAGRTPKPNVPIVGRVRLGGFGGVAGLAQYLQDEQVDMLVDMTHPFAVQIKHNAATAAAKVGIPRVLFSRPAWEKHPDDHWIEAKDLEAAAAVLPSVADRVFLTIGRQELSAFSQLRSHWFLMRMITQPEPTLRLPPGEILFDQGPFDVLNETELLKKYNIGAIVSKNSGGNAAYAKVIAAREMGMPIVMIPRPPLPEGDVVPDLERAVDWVKAKMKK